MVAGTQRRGMFEQRFKDPIKQAEDAEGKVILFTDEMHRIVGAGDRGGAMDGANILKPTLAHGRIRCMGATTSEEYHKYIAMDAALERQFQKVDVEEPSVQATIVILQGLKHKYQKHHGLKIQDDAIVAAARVAARCITELARALAEKLFDSEKTLIRFDISKYADGGSMSLLTGGPRSCEEDGQLTEKVKSNPYSVILFDHVDKADPSVFKVKKHLKPELIDRLSEVVIFEPFSHDGLKEVVKIQMKSVAATVVNKGVSLFTNDAALDVIWSESYDLTNGSRPIKRWVQKNVTTVLSDMLVNGEACEGSTISIDTTDGKRGLKYQVMKE
ncbi:hypothetical protein ACQ4PT_019631 [Festuca glaucescens]